jgi:hypothetical protein
VTDAAQLEQLLRRVVREAVQEALAGASRLTAEERVVVDALGQVFGVGATTTRDILAALDLEIGHRPALRQSLQALVPGLDRQKVGMALRAIVLRGGVAAGWRLQAATQHAGGRLWTLERTGRG